jgi:hypothetical protein
MTTVLFAPLCPSQPFELSPQRQALQLSRLAINVKMPSPCEEELHFGLHARDDYRNVVHLYQGERAA